MCIYLCRALMSVCATLLAVPASDGLGTTLLPGDIYVQVFAAIYSDLQDNGTCSGVDSDSIENVAAIKWTFSELNKIDYIPGVKIGVRVSETCRSANRAKELAYNLADEIKQSKFDIIGVLGPGYSSETDVISRLLSALPDQQRLLQIGYASTSAFLSDRDIYKNFFRVIPPDKLQVEVMIDIVSRLNWTYMALIYDDDSYGIGGKDSLLSGVESRDICFPIQIPVDPSGYDISQLAYTIQSKILKAEQPIGGVLVFGSYFLADAVLRATENVLSQIPNATYPVFLFSEASGIIEIHGLNISRGAFIVSPPRRTVEEFQNQWVDMFTSFDKLYNESSSNKWLRDLYSNTFGCELAQTVQSNNCTVKTRTDIERMLPSSVYTQYAIQAALVMGKVVRQVHTDKCRSQTTGICPEMLETSRHTLIDMMKVMSVNFDKDFNMLRLSAFQQPSDLILTFTSSVEASILSDFPVYAVYNLQVCNIQKNTMCLKEVAQFHASTRLSVSTKLIKDYDKHGIEHTWPDIRKPQCPDSYLCSICLRTSSKDDATLFVPGDLYVVGIVPVHNIGPTPLDCGGFKLGGLDIVESIIFAVNEAKALYSDKVPKGSIGVIVIDSCYDPQIVQERILTLHRLGVYKDGGYIPVGDKIIGYVGGWSSDISKAAGSITSRLRFPQISYASTAPVLGRKSIYPYFLRVPSPDGEQGRVMLKIVQSLNANFIQIVYSESAYGEGGRDILLKLIDDMNICVAQTIGITATSDPADFIQSLRKYKDAKIVVMFVGSFEIEQLIIPLINQNLSKHEFLFISSEDWGTRISVSGFESLIGSITLAEELQLNNKFIDHMKNLKPNGVNNNPWIRQYMEQYFHCYYEWSYNKTSSKKCTGDESLDAYQQGYRIDAWSKFAEKAVLALLLGARSAMDQYCSQSPTICSNLRNNTQGFVDILKQTRLNDESGQQSRVFDDNGDGLAGYKIYTIALDSEGDYKKIGSSEQGGFTFSQQRFEDVRGVVTSTCGTQDVCQQCFPGPVVAAEADAPVGYIVMAVILAVICCVLAACLLFICNRRGCCLTIQHGRPRFTSTYLTPIYAKSGDVQGNRKQNKYTRPTLPPRLGDNNYDNVQDSNGSQGSRIRQPPVGCNDESSLQETHVSNPSQCGRNATDGSIDSNMGSTAMCDIATGSESGNIRLGLTNVAYQMDDRYITSGAMSVNTRGVAVQDNSSETVDKTSSVETDDKPADLNDSNIIDGGYLRCV